MDQRLLKILQMDDLHYRQFVDEQFRAGSVHFKELREMMEAQNIAIAQNTALTQQVSSNTADIVDLFGTSKKGLNFVQAVGAFLNRVARWLTPILVAGGAIWAILHGQPPRGGE